MTTTLLWQQRSVDVRSLYYSRVLRRTETERIYHVGDALFRQWCAIWTLALESRACAFNVSSQSC